MFISCSILGGLRANQESEAFLVHMIRALVRVRDAEYENVELWYTYHPDWVSRTVENALNELNLTPYSIHLPKFLIEFDDDQFKSVIDTVFPLIKKLGIKIAVLHPPGWLNKEGIDWPARLETLLTYSENSNCILTIENVPYIKNVDQFILDLLEHNSGRPLGVTIDLEFMYVNGYEIRDLIKTFGSNILNIHFRDSDGSLVTDEGRRKYLTPGMGKIDFYDIVKALHDAGYDKAITIEVSHRNRNNIIEAKAYAEKCLQKWVK